VGRGAVVGHAVCSVGRWRGRTSTPRLGPRCHPHPSIPPPPLTVGPLHREQNIVEFHVTVDDARRVHVGEAGGYLGDGVRGCRFRVGTAVGRQERVQQFPSLQELLHEDHGAVGFVVVDELDHVAG